MTDIRQAVVLAGGLGTRLRPLTNTTAKPMVLINGRPFLEYLVQLLRENNVSEVVLLLGYRSEQIMEHFGDGSRFGIKIRHSVGDVSFETGRRLSHAAHLIDDRFLLLYCDNYHPLNLANLLRFHHRHGALASVTVYSNKDGLTKNNVCVDEDGCILTYDRTRQAKELNGVEIGFFVLNKDALRYLPHVENVSLEDTLLPRLVEQRQLYGFRTDHRYYSIGSLDRIPVTETFLKPKKVVFLDRDGVINRRPPKADYVKTWEEFEFLPGALTALRLLTENGYQVYIISNQAGIARGIMTEADLDGIHACFRQTLKEHGARIQGIYYCPHGWDEGCSCRKPNPGLFLQAARDHHLDLSKTLFVGDDERDAQAGEAAGVKTLLVSGEQDLLHVVRSLVDEPMKPLSGQTPGSVSS